MRPSLRTLLSRGALAALLVAAAAGLVALGRAWRADRTRSWAAPRWHDSDFVPVAVAAPPAAARETWIVAVNPDCPHCRGHVSHVARIRGDRNDVRLGVLVVDTPMPPAASTFTEVNVDGTWWDSRQTWRRRWGHRLYGEVMVFDRGGRCLRTLPPGFEATALAAPHSPRSR